MYKKLKVCFHCGQKKYFSDIFFDNKYFCCNGCKLIYEILFKDFNQYYELNKFPGICPEEKAFYNFDFLDTYEIFNKIVNFSEKNITLITFHIPSIHCSSCILILESLKKLNVAIIDSHVNFSQKTVKILFNNKKCKLSNLAVFLSKLGYKPSISYQSVDYYKNENNNNNQLLIKIAIAGFGFGNAMLFSIPEYIANTQDFWIDYYKYLFRYLMFLFSIPVFLYSSIDYYKSAFFGIKNKILNIDVPISIGILVLFFRSLYEVYYDISSGYFDTLCGLLFFMLIGKFFQQKTYQSMSFSSDYKSFFPISVTKLNNNKATNILLSNLEVGDHILIRNEEIIPCDVILISSNAKINNSFITGESDLVYKKKGDKIYAGGKQHGSIIECKVIKKVDDSYLIQLWNHPVFKKNESFFINMTTKVSKYFTLIILIITFFSGLYWYFILKDSLSKMFQIIFSILIIACPCSLALSFPFVMGNMMRILAKLGLYVKDPIIIEKMSQINHVVLDKTGTISIQNKLKNVIYQGEKLTKKENFAIFLLVQNSNHPLSKKIAKFLKCKNYYIHKVYNFKEHIGKGIEANIFNQYYKLGSLQWILGKSHHINISKITEVIVSINDKIKGKFIIFHHYRPFLKLLINSLQSYYKISLISGDNSLEKKELYHFFHFSSNLIFDQSPEKKILYIQKLQKNKDIVLMIGDGLNDAGALKQSDVGIAISDDINNFFPASDAILNGSKFHLLYIFLMLAKKSIYIVWLSFLISFIYNIIGLYFAISGKLHPLIAAILMPMSSITVILFTTITTWYISRKYF